MSPLTPRLAVVILTWNGREDTLECLDALRGEIRGDDAVIVCDNGSQDGTEAAIRSRHPWVDLIQNGANLGFAGGNNSGLRSALDRGFEWMLLLNNDTSVPPGALAALLAHASRGRRSAPFSRSRSEPMTRTDRLGRPAGAAADRLRGRPDGPPTGDAPTVPTPIFGATASAALLRASTLRESGPFDEELFTILEDVDLMFRVRLAGARGGAGPAREGGPQARHLRGGGHPRGRAQAELLGRPQRGRAGPALLARPATWWRRRRCWPSVRRGRCCGRGGYPGSAVSGLWRRSCSARRANRRAMRRLGLDRWFSGASVSGRVAERTRAGTLGREALR